MSPTHTQFGVVTENLRFKRLGGNGQLMVAVGCRLEPFPLFGRNASQFHQRSGFMLAATKPKGFQFLG